jgi:hypothetical protein
MTPETLESLLRVIEKRIRQNTAAGRWTEVTAAITEKHALIARYHSENQGESK